MTNLKLGLIGVLLIIVVAAALVLQRQAQVQLQSENQSLRQQLEQVAQLAIENERLSNLVAQAKNANTLPTEQMQELLRLRGEVGRLRQDNRALERLKAENQQLRTGSAPQPSPAPAASNPPIAQEPLIPAEAIKFTNTELRQVLAIYGEMAGAQLDIEETLRSLPVLIHFTNTGAVTRAEAIRLLDAALLEQAGIVVTHPETNRVMMRLRR